MNDVGIINALNSEIQTLLYVLEEKPLGHKLFSLIFFALTVPFIALFLFRDRWLMKVRVQDRSERVFEEVCAYRGVE